MVAPTLTCCGCGSCIRSRLSIQDHGRCGSALHGCNLTDGQPTLVRPHGMGADRCAGGTIGREERFEQTPQLRSVFHLGGSRGLAATIIRGQINPAPGAGLEGRIVADNGGRHGARFLMCHSHKKYYDNMSYQKEQHNCAYGA